MLSKTLKLAVLLAATVASTTGIAAASSNTIVDLAVATPDLSTLVAALKAADLVDTLSGKGPFTVFAPTNEAFAALPAGVLANLLKPENKAQLVDILTYHVASGDVHAKDLYDKEMIPTVEGKNVTARVSSDGIFINSAKVTAADNDASNGVVHIIDAVLMPGGAPSQNHLWFRGWTGGGFNIWQCGEVDAAPRIPKAMFDPSNAAALKAYEFITIALYAQYPLGVKESLHLELGRCADNNYTKLRGGQDVDWAPVQLMEEICQVKCNCNFTDARTSSGQLPKCKDEPDDPTAAKWCSLCGPVFNKPIRINLFSCGASKYTDCPGPKMTPATKDWATVLKDLYLWDERPSTEDPINKVLLPPAAPASNNTLFFYYKNPAFNRCGDVDAAPRMPASLFEPQNALELQMYITATEQLYHVKGMDRPNPDLKLHQGRCKDHGYSTKLPYNTTAAWAPTKLMSAACDARCKCVYPACPDVPDDPNAQRWCSLCGPKFNAPIEIALWNPTG